MVANEEILRLNQAAIEVTRGTDLPATRKVYANIAPNFTKAIREFTDTSGTYEGDRRVAFQREVVTLGMTDLATFEDLAWWMQLGMKGAVTGGAGDAGVPPMYTYTFVPTLAVDDLKSITLEWNHVGNAYQSTQVMLNTWQINIDPDNEGAWILTGEMLALGMDTTTHTGAIGDRSTQVVKAPTTTFWIDETDFTGMTQQTDKLISATISCDNAIHYKAFAEHEKQFAANKVGRGKRKFRATVTMEFDSDAEFAKFRAGTQRFIRFESIGPIIHDAVANKVTIDMNGYWETISIGNRQGNIIATFGLSAFYNAVTGFSAKMVILNDEATLV